MYPLTRLRKLRPDGVTPYISWYSYRLPDRDGFARFFVPSGTTRLREGSSWTPEGISIAAVQADLPFVVHWWQSADRWGFYVDAARAIDIGESGISYVDLYLDLVSDAGDWRLLDEAELADASPDDAILARQAIQEVRARIAAHDPLFERTSALWAVPTDALRLTGRRVAGL